MAWGLLTLAGLFGGYALVDTPATHLQEFGLDRFEPLHADRQIHLTNAHAVLREKQTAGGALSLRLGLVAQHARGEITQLTDTLAQQTLDSPGTGLGLSAEARLRLWGGLHLDASAAPMLYDRRFPAGGTHYNGMFQAGPSFSWPMGTGRWTIGARWLHISNGRGLGPDNPSTEGRGLVLRYQLPL
jgi:hypothetical protein